MRKIHLTFVLCGLLLSPSVAFAQDEARAIVEKAIQAQGGPAKVAKLRTMRIRVEGTTSGGPSELREGFIMEETWQMPTRYKTEVTYQVMGEKRTQLFVIDGDKGWLQADGLLLDMPKGFLTERKEQQYAKDLDCLGFLNEKGMELSLLDEIKVERKPAVGILVKSKGHRDVKLYFDKQSGLLVRRVHPVHDEMTDKEVEQAVTFRDYQEKDGLKHYHRVLDSYKRAFTNARVTELEFFEKLDPKVFAKPRSAQP
jgi:hypothetical protein